jgi:UDP-glucuronate decarboxylase
MGFVSAARSSVPDDPGHFVRSLVPSKLVERIQAGNEVFVVTGATGWFGTATVHILDEALGASSGQRLQAFAATGRRVELRSGRTVEVRPLRDLLALEPSREPVCVLHFAYLMRHLAAVLGHDEFVRQNRDITATMLDALGRLHPIAFAFASSGAVYSATGGLVDDVERDPYATLKHRDELAFEQRCLELGVRCIVGRIFSVGGPFMPDRDRFVLADLVDRASAGVPLVIRARHELWRSYVGLGDLIAVFLAEALDGHDPVTHFDTGGEVVEAGELAARVRAVLNAPDVEIRRELDVAAPADRYIGEGATFEALAARHGCAITPLDEQIRQVALG